MGMLPTAGPGARAAAAARRRRRAARSAAGPGALVLALALAGMPAAAQDPAGPADWQVTFAPYVWAPGATSAVRTPFGTVRVRTSPGDVIAATEFAAMGVLEARRGRWALIADLVAVDLVERAEAPLAPLFGSARLETRLTQVSAFAAYRVHDDGRFGLDALAGLRSARLDLGLALAPGLLPAQRLDLGTRWLDPLVGLRVRVGPVGRWSATALADIGGFGFGSDLTWQVVMTLGYRIGDRWTLQAGWRQLHIDRLVQGSRVRIDQGGPVVGASLRF